MKNNYIFPAVFSKAEDGYSISFPDLPGAFTCGKKHYIWQRTA